MKTTANDAVLKDILLLSSVLEAKNKFYFTTIK